MQIFSLGLKRTLHRSHNQNEHELSLFLFGNRHMGSGFMLCGDKCESSGSNLLWFAMLIRFLCINIGSVVQRKGLKNFYLAKKSGENTSVLNTLSSARDKLQHLNHKGTGKASITLVSNHQYLCKTKLDAQRKIVEAFERNYLNSWLQQFNIMIHN